MPSSRRWTIRILGYVLDSASLPEGAIGSIIRAMTLPTLSQAEALLEEAAARNPGFGWVSHSRYVADAAARLAAEHPALDPERARILGLLHDVGRREGATHNRHMLDGYRYLTALGYDEAARICLTHSFPIRDIVYAPGRWDTTEEEYAFIAAYLLGVEYDDYDRLLQLCDALALPDGFCLLEKRLVDVALRHGVNDTTVARWRGLFELRDTFSAALGRPVYDLLPGVVENTFRL